MLGHLNKLKKKLFSKGDEDLAIYLPDTEKATFVLSIDKIQVGILRCENGEWQFGYADEFKRHSEEYKAIVGFPDLNKEYRSDSLWPFFRIRIPGLKQPVIKEILEEEQIDKENEVALLRRFGYKTISNPYKLVIGTA